MNIISSGYRNSGTEVRSRQPCGQWMRQEGEKCVRKCEYGIGVTMQLFSLWGLRNISLEQIRASNLKHTNMNIPFSWELDFSFTLLVLFSMASLHIIFSCRSGILNHGKIVSNILRVNLLQAWANCLKLQWLREVGISQSRTRLQWICSYLYPLTSHCLPTSVSSLPSLRLLGETLCNLLTDQQLSLFCYYKKLMTLLSY